MPQEKDFDTVEFTPGVVDLLKIDNPQEAGRTLYEAGFEHSVIDVDLIKSWDGNAPRVVVDVVGDIVNAMSIALNVSGYMVNSFHDGYDDEYDNDVDDDVIGQPYEPEEEAEERDKLHFLMQNTCVSIKDIDGTTTITLVCDADGVPAERINDGYCGYEVTYTDNPHDGLPTIARVTDGDIFSDRPLYHLSWCPDFLTHPVILEVSFDNDGEMLSCAYSRVDGGKLYHIDDFIGQTSTTGKCFHILMETINDAGNVVIVPVVHSERGVLLPRDIHRILSGDPDYVSSLVEDMNSGFYEEFALGLIEDYNNKGHVKMFDKEDDLRFDYDTWDLTKGLDNAFVAMVEDTINKPYDPNSGVVPFYPEGSLEALTNNILDSDPTKPYTVSTFNSAVYHMINDIDPEGVHAVVTVAQPFNGIMSSTVYVNREEETIEFEYAAVMMTLEKPGLIDKGSGIVVRVFSDDDAAYHDEENHISHSRLGVFYHKKGQYIGVDDSTVMESHCTDPDTGEIMLPEDGVAYVDLDGKVYRSVMFNDERE